MKIKRLICLITPPLLLSGLVVGCGSSDAPLGLQPFGAQVELQVNQQHNHTVILSRAVNEKTFVDLDYATHSDFLEIPESVTIKVGEKKATFKVVGKAVTPQAKGQWMTLTFTLRGTDSSRDWYYRVEGDPGTNPPPPPPPPPPADAGPADADPGDAGPPPDAADPDAGPAPDAPPPPDAAPDAGPDA